MVQDFTALGERELDVMAVLWERGSGTVAEVRAQLEAQQGVSLAYTTVLTILRNLEGKQYVSREEEGRAHRYFPRVARQAAQRTALARLVSSLFGGSPEALVAGLVEQEQLSATELAQLARSLNTATEGARAGRRGASPYREEGDA
jgi:predicted transcriptional regulator